MPQHRLHLYLSAQGPSNVAAYSQAEANALLVELSVILYLSESFEEFLQLVLADADAGVLYYDTYRLSVHLDVAVDAHVALHGVFNRIRN